MRGVIEAHKYDAGNTVRFVIPTLVHAHCFLKKQEVYGHVKT